MAIAEEVELLRKIPLFADIELSKLKLLAFTSERVNFAAGEVVFHQNDIGTAAYIIIRGEADVIVDRPSGPITVAHVKQNDFIGEIAILCDVPRTATVVARTELATLCISKDLFFRLITEFPQMAVAVMRVLAQRLEKMNRQLSDGGPALKAPANDTES